MVLSKKRVIQTIVIHRLIVYIIQWVASSFDFSTDAFKGLPDGTRNESMYLLFNGLVRWDSLQFLHIAKYGYIYEHSLAFFPLFPTLIRTISLFCPRRLFSLSTSIVFSGVILNLFFFILSSLIIRDISLKISRSQKIADISLLLFSINPASIFFSSLYTESLYSFMSFVGIWAHFEYNNNVYLRLTIVPIVFSAAVLTRSNGLFNICYILFYEAVFLIRNSKRRLWEEIILEQFIKIGFVVIRLIFSIGFILFCLHAYSKHQHNRFCSLDHISIPSHMLQYGRDNNLTVIGDVFPWCNIEYILIPSFYSSIQERYWNVDLFGYWKISKLPCFLMATPAIILTLVSISNVFTRFITNGLEWTIDRNGDTVPFAFHSIALLIPALFVYNVEVFTRIVFCSSPLLYIELARILSDNTPKVTVYDLDKPTIFPFIYYLSFRKDLSYFIALYFMSYYLIGSVMHSSFLPFT